MRAATYVRLSSVRGRVNREEAEGLERQREATEQYVEAHGWSLEERHRFQDAGISAYSGAERPGLEAVRGAIARDEVDVLVVWKLDRAFRSIPDAAAFLAFLREHDAHLVATSQGIDTSTEYGGVMFSIFAALGEVESSTRSDRITAWHAQRAEEGLPGGGGYRPFGFREDRVHHETSEVREIRKAARALLAGRTTLTGIVRDWNARGVKTPTGGRWRLVTVRRVLTAPRTAGLREHGLRNGANGRTHRASWKPILTEEQHVAINALFDARRRREAVGDRYLLTKSGLAVCGECGHPLVARPKADGRRCYVCPSRAEGGCGKIRILAADFEEHVARQVARVYDRSEPVGDEPEPDWEADLRREQRADEEALVELSRDRYVRRVITPEEHEAARAELVARMEEREAQLRRLARTEGRRRLVLDPRESGGQAPWELPVGESPDPQVLADWRDWVAEVVERVVVKPAVKGRNFFHPSRVDIEWSVKPAA